MGKRLYREVSQSHIRLCIVCFMLLIALSVMLHISVYLFSFQALDLTVQLMEMQEKALIQTDAKYAYGGRGR